MSIDYQARGTGSKNKEQIVTQGAQLDGLTTTISSIENGSPKGVYATLALLEATYPTGATGAFVVTESGYWYWWDGDSWEQGGLYQSAGIIGTNSIAKIIEDCTYTNYNSTVNSETSRTINVTFGSGVSSNINLNSKISMTVGDFGFLRVKISSSSDCLLKIVMYTEATDQSVFQYNMETDKEYEFYIRTKELAHSGELHAQIQVNSTNAFGQTIDISEFIVVPNSYDAWYDYDSLQTLKDYTENKLIVDKAGNGHFYGISDACNFLKNAFDVDNLPFVVFVRNGNYQEITTNDYPYSAINKGANRISIIGESREGVVVVCENTSLVQSKLIHIGGPSSIENITLKCLNDGTYNNGNDLSHGTYVLHNDDEFNAIEAYITAVKNCKIYSNCHSPVGAGLQDYQTQRYENCEFVSDGIISNGALYIHGPSDVSALNMGVEIISCSCVSLDGTKAITLPDVVGSLQYTDIPVTIQKTIGYTTGATMTDANFKTTHDLQPQSALNNVDDWNI